MTRQARKTFFATQLLATPLLLVGLQGQSHVATRIPFINRLERGINLDGWFNGAGAKPDRFGQKDLKAISSLGFTFVRLPLDPRNLMTGGRFNPDSVAALDRALDLITGSGLAVIADIHPVPDAERIILSDDDSLRKFVSFIEALCTHLKRWRNTDLGVELLNEPFDPKVGHRPWNWNAIQSKLWTAARRALPDHALILTGDAWSSMSGLRSVVPVSDSNVIYTVHFYQPYQFSHQGANWMASNPLHLAQLRRVPYPGDSLRVQNAVASTLPTVTTSPLRDSIRTELMAYAREGWDRGKLAQSFSQTAAWAAQHHARLFLGEFGVYRRGADAADRCRWLTDVRELAEANGFAWAMWEYDGGFGLLDDDGSPDSCVLNALGFVRAAPR